ncbi:hypothetical protein QCE63_26355 [Caballeronia sp. LZ065]|uniref:hypothetical protein n=1 Tax=Caballeronia sp. LZ065 TaxID=3038571 RepID=UPI0028655281|nr:hypothetical protein [Caballeronia sp. LZ065]MDR5782934.1 hypothetical protein [Caballeronia sp. LZ065]
MTLYLYDEQTFDSPASFQPVALTAGTGRNERWLQERIFELPKLLPMGEMFGHGESFVPLCRELPLRYGSSSVFLDILGVSVTGRLVLVQCKLWRNPKARREVIAQLFEYASLLSEWTYSDLEARLKKARGLTGQNPIFAAVEAVYPGLGEAAFVDSVNRSLDRGDFLCAIAGDGIRSDLQSLRRLLGAQGGVLSQLALVEIRRYCDAAGRTLLVPSVPLHTEVVQREVLVRPDGVLLEAQLRLMKWCRRSGPRLDRRPLARRGFRIARSGTNSLSRLSLITRTRRRPDMAVTTSSAWIYRALCKDSSPTGSSRRRSASSSSSLAPTGS